MGVYLWVGLVYYLYIKFVLCSLPLKEKCHEIFFILCFGTKLRKFASIFVPQKRSCFLFEIPRVCFYFCSTRYGIPSIFLFRQFSVPRNSRNSVGTNDLFHLFRLPLNYFFVGISQPVLLAIATPDRYNSRLHNGHF